MFWSVFSCSSDTYTLHSSAEQLHSSQDPCHTEHNGNLLSEMLRTSDSRVNGKRSERRPIFFNVDKLLMTTALNAFYFHPDCLAMNNFPFLLMGCTWDISLIFLLLFNYNAIVTSRVGRWIWRERRSGDCAVDYRREPNIPSPKKVWEVQGK